MQDNYKLKASFSEVLACALETSSSMRRAKVRLAETYADCEMQNRLKKVEPFGRLGWVSESGWQEEIEGMPLRRRRLGHDDKVGRLKRNFSL